MNLMPTLLQALQRLAAPLSSPESTLVHGNVQERADGCATRFTDEALFDASHDWTTSKTEAMHNGAGKYGAS